MKNLLFVSCLFLSAPLFAADAKPEADILQRSLEAECKESWCRGAYALSFRRVLVDPKREEVIVQLTLRNTAHVAMPTIAPDFDARLDQDSFGASCRIKGLGGELLEAETKRPVPLFREGLGACIQSLAERVNRLWD